MGPGALAWTFYNVGLPALAPLLLTGIVLWLKNRPVDIRDMIGDGQLCFFSMALLAVTLHDIEGLPETSRRQPWAGEHLPAALPSCYMTGVLAIVIFALIVEARNTATATVRNRLTAASACVTVVSMTVVYYWRYHLGLFE